MKKIILSLLFFASLAAHAQISVSPELGLNMANMSIKTSGDRISTSIKKGFVGGIMDEVGLSHRFYLQDGLLYAFNGCNVTNTGYFKIHSLQLPVSLVYKTGMPGGNRFFIGAGPYVGLNLNGSSKGLDTTSTVHIGNKSTDEIKRIDWGLGITAGVSVIDRVYLRIRYQFSVASVNSSPDEIRATRLLSTGITIGYTFGNSTPHKALKKHKVVKKG